MFGVGRDRISKERLNLIGISRLCYGIWYYYKEDIEVFFKGKIALSVYIFKNITEFKAGND